MCQTEEKCRDIDVSIIIVNYHSAPLTISCFRSLVEKTHELTYEVIIVDNDSSEEEYQKLNDALGDASVLIQSEKNLGFGKANNLAAKHASGKYLFLLNPDTILKNNAVKILYDFMSENPSAGVSGGNLFKIDGSPAPSYSEYFDDPEKEKKNAAWTSILIHKCRQRFHLPGTLDSKSFNRTGEIRRVAYVFGADMMLSRKAFYEARGFDPDFFMYGEEQELTYRIVQMGYEVYSVPQAEIMHLDGATLKEVDSFSLLQFGMRMNGMLTLHFKCYGSNGMEKAYKYRRLNYQRRMRLATFRNKQETAKNLGKMIDCLDKEYAERIKNLIGVHPQNGRD